MEEILDDEIDLNTWSSSSAENEEASHVCPLQLIHIRYISIVVAPVITIINFITMGQSDQSHIVLDTVPMSNEGGHPCPRESIK